MIEHSFALFCNLYISSNFWEMNNVLRVDVAQVTSNQIKSFNKIIFRSVQNTVTVKIKNFNLSDTRRDKKLQKMEKNIRRGKKVKKYHFLSQNCFSDVIINQTRLFLSNLAAFSRSIFFSGHFFLSPYFDSHSIVTFWSKIIFVEKFFLGLKWPRRC